MIQLKRTNQRKIKLGLTRNDARPDKQLFSRKELAARWGVSTETIKRRARSGILPTMRFNQRLLRYKICDIERIERDAYGGVNEQPVSSGGAA